MRSILRDPGAEVVVGLLGFSVSFLAIGLALIALELAHYGYVAFGIFALLLIFAVIAILSLSRHFTKTKRHIQQIGEYLRQGRELRRELLSVRTIPEWTEEMKGKVPQWKAGVQQWLDDNLPDYALEFDVEGFLVDLDTIGVNSEAGSAAQHLEGRMSNLREILREIRR